MSDSEATHRFTLRLPLPVWNGVKLKAIQKNETYNAIIVETLRERFGEIGDLSKLKVASDAS
jgi:hypothetical protein